MPDHARPRRLLCLPGRDVEQFHNTMGLFLNCAPLRTEITDCTSFRDIVARTKETFIDTIAHELPVNVIEQMFPDFISSRDDLRTSQFIISNTPGQLGQDLVFPIAEGAREIAVRRLEEDGQRDIPSGTVWFGDWPCDGTLSGSCWGNDAGPSVLFESGSAKNPIVSFFRQYRCR